MMNRGFAITGTDTGVGKTYVTAAILAMLRRQGIKAAAFKPIACGAGGRNDARIYHRLMDKEVPLDLINPIYLRHPLAPSVAAGLARRRIDPRRVYASYRRLIADYTIVLVEGTGGLMVPIRGNFFVADLFKQLGLPMVVVARLGLGTINHSVLTVRQAQVMGLTVRGIILNDTGGGSRGLAERTNVQVVPRLCGVPLLGVMKYGGDTAGATSWQICRKLISDGR